MNDYKCKTSRIQFVDTDPTIQKKVEASIVPSVSMKTPIITSIKSLLGVLQVQCEPQLSPRTALQLWVPLWRSWAGQQWPAAAAWRCPSPARWAGLRRSSPGCPTRGRYSRRAAPSGSVAAPSGSEAEAWTDRWLTSCPTDRPQLHLTDTQRVGYSFRDFNAFSYAK